MQTIVEDPLMRHSAILVFANKQDLVSLSERKIPGSSLGLLQSLIEVLPLFACGMVVCTHAEDGSCVAERCFVDSRSVRGIRAFPIEG